MAHPSAGPGAQGQGLARADIVASFHQIIHMDISVHDPAIQRAPGNLRPAALLLVSELLESITQIPRFRAFVAMETVRSSHPEKQRLDRSPPPRPDVRQS